MPHSVYGVALTDGQKQILAAAMRAGQAVTLWGHNPSSLTLLMLTATQINKIRRAKAAGQGVNLRLSKLS